MVRYWKLSNRQKISLLSLHEIVTNKLYNKMEIIKNEQGIDEGHELRLDKHEDTSCQNLLVG